MVIHELEQKFGILTQLLPRFRSNRGSPPFQHLHSIRTEHFEDKLAVRRGSDLAIEYLKLRRRGRAPFALSDCPPSVESRHYSHVLSQTIDLACPFKIGFKLHARVKYSL